MNQSQSIEHEIEEDLAKDWNQTGERVKDLVKEVAALSQQRREEKKKASDLTKKVAKDKSLEADLQGKLQDKENERSKTKARLSDPSLEGPGRAQAEARVEMLANEIGCVENQPHQKQQDVFREQKEIQEAKDHIREMEQKSASLKEASEDARFDLLQNASSKAYHDTKLKKERTKTQSQIDSNSQQEEHAKQRSQQLLKEAGKASQAARDHKALAQEQTSLLN